MYSDRCWWCESKGKQSREHLSKECRRKGSSRGEKCEDIERPLARGILREGKGQGGKRRVRPNNTSVSDLLGDEGFADVVLEFWEKNRVGEVKEGILPEERVRGNANRLELFGAVCIVVGVFSLSFFLWGERRSERQSGERRE